MRKKINSGLKNILIIYGGILLILIITCVIVYTVYTNKVKKMAEQSLINSERIATLVPNDIEETSSEISKTISEVIEDTKEQIISNTPEDEIENNSLEENNIEVTNLEQSVVAEQPEPVKELTFMYPVEGEIQKEFAIDNLVFSETLQEWIVHKGIDINAERTTVVKAAEEGTVKSIKTDPRYGLTIIVEHRDGYKTIYSNLLTTEFVQEGENVEKGQSLGTVGNSAAFEIADKPHLHFEMTKDEQPLDPTLYCKK